MLCGGEGGRIRLELFLEFVLEGSVLDSAFIEHGGVGDFDGAGRGRGAIHRGGGALV